VGISWTETRSKFKSPLWVVARFCWLGREAKAAQCRRLKRVCDDARATIVCQAAELQRQAEKIRVLQQKVRCLEEQPRPPATEFRLPTDPPLKGHKFGLRLMALAANLAKIVGLRAAERVLTTVWEWLGVQQQLPDWTTIRTWLMRLGVAALREPMEPADDWVWMADHSNQIGPEKALVVLGVRAGQLPPRGTALRHEDVRVLTVRPGTAWKREDVARVYEELAERYGAPRAALSDGAVELREGALGLQKRRADAIILQDFKHKAAIFLKSAVGDQPRFAEFNTQQGKARSAIQQTELAHLTPPGQKPKARFMNLAATLDWAAMVLWLLDHPEAEARRGVTSERLQEKLGWLRSFAGELAQWRECQEVVKAGVTFINEQGLFRGAGEQLRAALGTDLSHAASRELAQRLVDFVITAERQLQEGERLPMSTEILESTFALYKQLERQHSKGGFTSLLVAFGALLKPVKKEDIRRAFSLVSVKDVHQWAHENLGTTLTSKRLAAYKEFRGATTFVTIT